MPRIDDINVLLGLHSLILNEVRAIYGPLYPTNTFSIISSRFDMGGTIAEVEYTAQAIVYLSTSEWKLLVEGAPGTSNQHAMEMLYRKCQEEVNDVTEKMGVGWIWDGRKGGNGDA